jgi:DNA repair ATPase RecN
MSPRAPDVSEQVVQFAPKERQRNDGDTLDQVGQAIVGLLQHAANVSNEACGRALGAVDKLSIRLRDAEDRCDRAVSAAEKLSNELRGANDRINQLQAELKLYHDRAERAEKWLTRIYQEIDPRQ